MLEAEKEERKVALANLSPEDLNTRVRNMRQNKEELEKALAITDEFLGYAERLQYCAVCPKCGSTKIRYMSIDSTLDEKAQKSTLGSIQLSCGDCKHVARNEEAPTGLVTDFPEWFPHYKGEK